MKLISNLRHFRLHLDVSVSRGREHTGVDVSHSSNQMLHLWPITSIDCDLRHFAVKCYWLQICSKSVWLTDLSVAHRTQFYYSKSVTTPSLIGHWHMYQTTRMQQCICSSVYHSSFHLAHCVEIELLFAVIEATDNSIALGLSTQNAQSSQISLEVLRQVLLSSCKGTFKSSILGLLDRGSDRSRKRENRLKYKDKSSRRTYLCSSKRETDSWKTVFQHTLPACSNNQLREVHLLRWVQGPIINYLRIVFGIDKEFTIDVQTNLKEKKVPIILSKYR